MGGDPPSCVSAISAETPSRARRGRAAAAGFGGEEGAERGSLALVGGEGEVGWLGERGGLRRGEAAEEAAEWLGDDGRYRHTPTGVTTVGATDVTVSVSPPHSRSLSRTVLGFHGGSLQGDEGS
eukprot:scaffold85833_cov51-Phaeocystis_antarctica.AAC.1